MRKLLAAAAIALAALLVWWFTRSHGGGDGGHSAGPGSAATGTRPGAASTVARVDRHGGDPASLAGTVTLNGGAPIAGAWVCASAYDEDLVEAQREPRCTATAADGGWKLDGLFAARWMVSGGADGKIPASWRGPDRKSTLALHAGEARTGVDLVLADGGVLVTGTVLDLTGGPIADALVQVGGGFRSDRASCVTRSGDDGRFRCWVAPGQTFASASADGYTDGWVDVQAPTDGVELLLTPEATLGGTVVLAGSREPVAGARVDVAGDWGQAESTAITDAQGHFHVAHLAPGRYKPVATAPGLYGEAAESVLVGLAQGKDGLVIELHPAATVRGTVTRAGQPVDDCSVSLAGAGNERYVAGAEADGTVTFDAVQPGSYHVTLRCGKENATGPYPDVVVADQPVEAAWAVDAGVTLSGVVVDDAGAPVAHAWVSARTEAQSMWGGSGDTTDDDGTFTLEGLAAGPATLEVAADDHPSPDPAVAVELGKDHDVRVVLPAGGELTGRVVTASGAPVAGVDVDARSDVRRVFEMGGGAKTGADGSFRMRGLRPGDYRVVATRAWRPLRRPGTTDDDRQGEKVSVVAGKTASVKLVVEDPSGTITGKVLDVGGAPVTDAFLRAERESDAAGAQQGNTLASARWSWDRKPAITGTDGTFTIEDLSPGTYTVLAYRKGGSEAKQQGVAVGASVTLTIERTGSLSGAVTSPAGPPRKVTISVADKLTGYDRTESFFFAGGRWAIRDLPAGTYDLAAVTPDGKAKLEGVALAAGEDKTGVDLALTATVAVTGRLVDAETRAPIRGLQVFITPIGGPLSIGPADMEDPDHVSGEDGRFKVKNVAVGKTGLIVFPPFGPGEDDVKYSSTMRNIDVEGSGTVDLGDVALHASRLPPNTPPGDLGFTLAEYPPGANPADVKIQVASVRKDGPAATAGLRVGDVIVSVDGHDVRGDNAADYYVLANVPAGTTVSFGLERGATVAIEAAKAE